MSPAVPEYTDAMFAAKAGVETVLPAGLEAAYQLYVEGYQEADRALYEEALAIMGRLIPDPSPEARGRGVYYKMPDGGYVGKGDLPGCKCTHGKINIIHLNRQPEWMNAYNPTKKPAFDVRRLQRPGEGSAAQP